MAHGKFNTRPFKIDQRKKKSLDNFLAVALLVQGV